MWVHQCYCVALWMLQSHNHHNLQCNLLRTLSKFVKRLRNIFGPCCHLPHAMFCKYSKAHNCSISVGFIKLSECRMAGKQNALCRILWLQGALRVAVNLVEFIALHNFKKETSIIQSDDFWKYLFAMCCALYSPMCVLHLADQKNPCQVQVAFLCLSNWH